MNSTILPPKTAPYAILEARGVGARSHEAVNAGVVLFSEEGPMVSVVPDIRRLAGIHPDYLALDLDGMAVGLQDQLRRHAELPVDQLHALLHVLCQPLAPSACLGLASVEQGTSNTLRELMAWLVHSPQRTLPPIKRNKPKPPTRLAKELREWLRGARVFSSRVEDISKGKVVANYPVDPAADLFADFALMNGRLNAIETLDLRGVERLTPTQRGDAAIKGITLDEARERIDAKRIVVLSASDHAVARPAIQMVTRYADVVFNMQEPSGRQQLADLVAKALKRPEFPELNLAT